MPLNVMALDLGSNTTKSSLSAPVYSKLGSGSASTSDTTQPAPDLSPVKFDGSDDATMAPVTANPVPVADSSDAGTLNAAVEKEGFAPKPPVERTDNVVGEESVVSAKDKKKQTRADAYEKSLREAANRVGPIELRPTDKEVREKVLTIRAAEKAELAEIWDAALCRSQDIQFVVQKLMPTKDPKHSTAVMMKMLSTAMYGTVAAGSIVGRSVGGPGAGMAQSAGASMVMSVFNQVDKSSQRKMAVTETEAIMLYKMIRDVGRDVSHDFHEYKKNVNQVGRACADYADIQKMVADAPGQDTITAIQMECLLRKMRREIDGLNEDARNSRDSLVTLAGDEAVDNLDKQIDSESEKIGQPLVAQDDMPKEESAARKVADKTESVDEAPVAARKKAVATAHNRKKVPVAVAKPEGEEANADQEAADTSPVDKSSDKPL